MLRTSGIALRYYLVPKLPAEFHQAIPSLGDADLIIVMGTSLSVQPFAMLAGLVPDDCHRSVCSAIRQKIH